MKFEIKENGAVVKCTMTNQKIPVTSDAPKTGDTTNTAILVLGMAVFCTSSVEN